MRCGYCHVWSGTRCVLGFVGQRKCQHCRTSIPPANNMQELKDATTYDTSLVLFSERVKQAILFLQLTKLENHRLHILPLKKSHIPDRMCQKCNLQYIGETTRQLNERFGEHWRSILNHQQLSTTTPVSLHFNQASHSINDVSLIPIELIRSNRDSVRKDREAHLINKAKILYPFGVNRRDEARQLVTHLTLIYS